MGSKSAKTPGWQILSSSQRNPQPRWAIPTLMLLNVIAEQADVKSKWRAVTAARVPEQPALFEPTEHIDPSTNAVVHIFQQDLALSPPDSVSSLYWQKEKLYYLWCITPCASTSPLRKVFSNTRYHVRSVSLHPMLRLTATTASSASSRSSSALRNFEPYQE
jgi:hypothetical protein